MGDVVPLNSRNKLAAAEALRDLAGRVERGDFGDVVEGAVVFRRVDDEHEFIATAWPEDVSAPRTAQLFAIGADITLAGL